MVLIRTNNFLRIALACLFAAIFAAPVEGSTPRLNFVAPRGVQLGQEQVVVFHGERLNDAEEILFYDPGIEVIDLKPLNPKSLQVKLKVNADCRIGEHVVQVRTRLGVSDYQILYVEAYPSVEEKEPNNTPELAQLISAVNYDAERPLANGIVVAGVADAQDVDWYRVTAKTGQRLSLEVVGMRLGNYCDTILSLHRADGERDGERDGELITESDDTPATGQDPCVSIKIPEDGDYLIRLTDAAGKGSKLDRYRLHLGNFPRPLAADPAIVADDEFVKITFLGDIDGPIEQVVSVDQTNSARGGVLVADLRGTAPTPIMIHLFDASAAAPAMESDPAPDDADLADEKKFEPPVQQAPFIIDGVVATASEIETHKFLAKKDDVLLIDCLAFQIGSPMDSIIQLRNSKNKILATNDDVNGTDSFLRFQVPADDEYQIKVWDARRDFGPLHKYRLSVTSAVRQVSLGIQKQEPFSQIRQQIAVHRGNRFATVLTAERKDLENAVEVIATELPTGVAMTRTVFPDSQNAVPVVFTANESAELAGVLVDFQVTTPAEIKSNSTSVVGQFLNHTPMMRIQPGNMVFKYCDVDRLAVAVLDPVPFRIELAAPAAPLARSGKLNLQIRINREEGFEQPVTLKIPYRAPGVKAVTQIVAKPDQDSINFEISATDKATLGKWPICVTGESNHQGPVVVSTQLQTISIVDPAISVDAKPAKALQGEEIEIECELEFKDDKFEGKATLQFVGLPTGASAEPATFSSDQSSVKMKIQLDAKTRPGNYRSINCQIAQPHADQQITYNAGNLALRVTKAAPAKKNSDREKLEQTKSDKL